MKLSVLAATVMAAMAGTVAFGVATAHAQSRPKNACIVYEKFNFTGKSWGVPRNGSTARSNASNRISSVRVQPGCVMIAFGELNFRGPSVQFSRDTPAINATWNNVISSYRCPCR